MGPVGNLAWLCGRTGTLEIGTAISGPESMSVRKGLPSAFHDAAPQNSQLLVPRQTS